MSLRILIADDEAPLRDWLKRLLAEAAPDAVIVAEAGDGRTALAEIERLRPDVAFLDIRMPGLSGLQVAAKLAVPCRVVFVTAFDEFALQAFDQAAVDYLVKPVTPERLARTLERLRLPPAPDQVLLGQLLARLKPVPSYLRWLRVGVGDTVQLLEVTEVDHFQAADKYTVVHAGDKEWLMRMSLKELEDQLDPEAFWRVHRSGVVRVAAIAQVRRDLMGRLWLELKSGGQALPVSRSFAQLFRQM